MTLDVRDRICVAANDEGKRQHGSPGNRRKPVIREQRNLKIRI
jgi:hypothetical protein